MGRESMNLRGQVFELDSRGTSGQDGMPASVVVRGVTPQGDAAESLTIEDLRSVWLYGGRGVGSRDDRGGAAGGAGRENRFDQGGEERRSRAGGRVFRTTPFDEGR